MTVLIKAELLFLKMNHIKYLQIIYDILTNDLKREYKRIEK